MRPITPLLIGALVAAVAPAQAAPEPNARHAAELDRALEGRTAGEPVDCLNLRDIRSSRIVNRMAILYETKGGTLYVNRPRSGAATLDKWDVLVTDTHSSRLCSIDVVHLYDPSLRMQTGFVGLGEFVPYRKPRD